MIAKAAAPRVALDDKWNLTRGRVFLNGTQAIVRSLLAQKEIDRRRGLNTAGYVSGYRGSPLGGVDSTLWSVAERLKQNDIIFQPGVNEDLAATALRGAQQIDCFGDATRDGVFAAWYGKGPGVDRSGDAFKHGNFAGSHRNGGVVLFYGDDHAGKSSTIAHHSEQALAASLIPSLYPADVKEVLEYAILGYALSRYSGSWVGVKCVNEVVEQTASIDIDLDAFSPTLPDLERAPPEGLHIRPGAFGPLREEEIVTDFRLPAIKQFVAANNIDRVVFKGPTARLGIVCAGKTYGDVRSALNLLGLDDEAAERLGISLYKVGCIWPLYEEGLTNFARDHEALLFVEEKQSFIEAQACVALVNEADRPVIVGKRDEDGAALLSQARQIEPDALAIIIAGRLARLGAADVALSAHVDALLAAAKAVDALAPPSAPRTPFFCSGCPHNRSTRIPEGSVSMTGIGCHTMATFVRPKEALLPTHMGAEGMNWVGLAPFTKTRHLFQNMGDGTYYHSGLLAIRAAIAANVNITYKILYNDAVAMTGGQPVDGPISVAEIAQQVAHEGARKIVILSDAPSRHRGNSGIPKGVDILHRDELDAVQRQLRDIPGCTILIYEQTCAAEKRRRRKRGRYPDPPQRLFIAEEVCEGCGDCSEQSTCVSIMPTETELGRKRKIDQASCNKDFSCLNGFCPSFITVRGGALRKSSSTPIAEEVWAAIPEPQTISVPAAGFNVMIAGIGGTGVITTAAILGMAAHLENRAVSMFDMTGLAQKNGAVFSHVKFAADGQEIGAQKIGRREADLALGFDGVALSAGDALGSLSKRARAVVNSNVAPTAAFQFDRDADPQGELLLARLGRVLDQLIDVPATSLAASLLGDAVGANLLTLGVASQLGLLPVRPQSIEDAVRLNGAQTKLNLTAFRLGRLWVSDPACVGRIRGETRAPLKKTPSLEELVDARAARLALYQDEAYANRYRALVERARRAEAGMVGQTTLSMVVAQNYAKVLAYKDEYEVARLLSAKSLYESLDRTFEGGQRLSFNLAPPLIAPHGSNGRPKKLEFDARFMRPALWVLAKLRPLRGTPFDVFGYTHERRMERALVREYEALVGEVLSVLTPANYAQCVRTLKLVDDVRGYGPVKAAAVQRYRTRLAEARLSWSVAEAELRDAQHQSADAAAGR